MYEKIKLTDNYQSGISGNIFIERINDSKSVVPSVMHYHVFYELYFLHAGNRDYVIDGEVFNLKNGCIALIKPGHMHMTEGGSYDRILIQFKHNYLETHFNQVIVDKLLRCFEINYIRIPVIYLEQVKYLFARLVKGYNKIDESLLVIHLAELLLTLYECSKEDNQQKDAPLFSDKRVTKILKYINTNYAEIENLSHISDAFFISKYYLCRLFKDSVGMTLITYLNSVKISHAMELLKTTDKYITVISSECGFNSPVQFSNTFKKHIKMSPKDYRKLKYR